MPNRVYRIVDGKRVYVRSLRPVSGAMTGRRRKLRLSKPVKKAIKKIVRSQEETKYWATQLMLNQTIDPAIHTPADPGNATPTGGDMYPLVPWMPEGDGESERVGRSITPTKCKFDVFATFNQQGDPPAVGLANVIYLVIYVLKSKVQRQWTPTSTQYLQLLDAGDGTSTMFGAPDGSGGYNTDAHFLEFPIEKSQFTLLKKKVIKLVKNDGFTNTGSGATTTYATSPNTSATCYRGSVSYKLPKLLWDTTDSHSVYPTNNGTFVAFGYCRGDNLTTLASPQMVSLSVRNHVWYKDA